MSNLCNSVRRFCGISPRLLALIFLLTALLRPSIGAAEETNKLNWDFARDRVSADISTWDVKDLLEHLATTTGWHVFLDPAGIGPVSVRFNDLPSGEALHVLLGKLNFAIVPETNGPSRFYVFRTSRTQATRAISPLQKIAKPIPNQLVVTLKHGSKTKIEDLAKLYGAKVIGRIDGTDSYLLQFDDASATQSARQELLNNPDVASVDYNFPIDAPPTPLSAAATSPDLQLNPKTNTGPCQIVVGLIDTAVQPSGTSWAQFVKPEIEATGQPAPPTSSQLTHGTAMIQTVLDAVRKTAASAQGRGGSVSTSVTIQPVNVYPSGETTSTFDVARGIVAAVNAGANVINLSLGGTGDSQVLHDTIINVTQQGIPIYAAAGNTPVTTPTYPAAYPEVTAVTATDPSGNIAPYANRGSFVSMTAPGDNIVSFDGQSYNVEGTSTSTAFVSGTAAALVDNAHVCPDRATALLKKSLPASTVLKASQ